ncbi:MAG: hypothetical protein IKC03_05665 [Oscillospiraceae bacterium]|nr:hypothetical protein [Oscillospiraceae bacterium]
MWTGEYYVRFVTLPATIDGVTVPNDDGSFDIYLNDRISPQRQLEKLHHEISHITHDHFYRDDLNIASIERQADGYSHSA